MPGFIYTVILADALLWFYLIRYLVKTTPTTTETKLIPLFVLLASLGLLFSFPIYAYLHKKAPEFTNLRLVYRKALKFGFYLSFGIVFIAALKIFEFLNIATGLSFLFLYYVVFTKIKNPRW